MSYPCRCGREHQYADEVADCERQAVYHAEREAGASPEEAHTRSKTS